MTAAHLPSDDTAIRAADDNRTVQAHRALDEAVAWLKRTPSWAALECVQQRALAVFLDRVRVLEAGPIKPPVGAPALGDYTPLITATMVITAEEIRSYLANPSPITPAPNGERLPVPVVPKFPRATDYR